MGFDVLSFSLGFFFVSTLHTGSIAPRKRNNGARCGQGAEES